jgi:predicted DNA-binding transcriptional regulator AlpA
MKPFFGASMLASAATVARIETLEAKLYSDSSVDKDPDTIALLPVSRRERAKLEASLKLLNRRKNDQAHRALARMRSARTSVSASTTTVVNVAPRMARRHVAGVRSSAASGDGNSDDSDPEPARPLLQNYLQLYDESSLADLLCISKKTIQNLYSKTPWLLPAAIFIPGARGPRWTVASVQAWLNDRPAHSAAPAPKAAAKNKVGRPRIALAVAGGAA